MSNSANKKSIAVTYCRDTNILWLWSWSYKNKDWTLISKTTVECGVVSDKTPEELFSYYRHFDADTGDVGNNFPKEFPYNYICVHSNKTFTAGPNEDWVTDNSIRHTKIKEIFGAKDYDII